MTDIKSTTPRRRREHKVGEAAGPAPVVKIRLPESDMAQLTVEAEAAGLSLSAFCREKVRAQLPADWQVTAEDRRLLHDDYKRLGITAGVEDGQLVATVVAFIRRPSPARTP